VVTGIKVQRKTEIIDMLCSCKGTCGSENYFQNLRDIGIDLKKNNGFIDASNFGLALSSTERLIILKALCEKDCCVCELEAILDKSQSTVSHHLRKLERAEIVKGYKKGSFTYYTFLKDNFKRNLDFLSCFC
jgi:DNA-binding transcriptional ArsR family regulator